MTIQQPQEVRPITVDELDRQVDKLADGLIDVMRSYLEDHLEPTLERLQQRVIDSKLPPYLVTAIMMNFQNKVDKAARELENIGE